MLGQLFLDLLIIASDVSTLGSFVSVFMNLCKSGSSAGHSLQTLLVVVSARCVHSCSHFFGMHFRPTVLPWVAYPALDLCNFLAGVLCFVAFFSQCYSTYDREKDNFGVPLYEKLGILQKGATSRSLAQDRKSMFVKVAGLYIVIAFGALAWSFMRSSPFLFTQRYFCCFYELMSAVALIPQFWMFHQDKRVCPLMANFVVLTALNRICTLTFWVCYPWVNFWQYPANRNTQMATECLNLLILSDFLYYWVRARLRGESTVVLGDDLDV